MSLSFLKWTGDMLVFRCVSPKPQGLSGPCVWKNRNNLQLRIMHPTVDGRNPTPLEVDSLSHYWHRFMHPRWCRISSINSILQTYISLSLQKTILSRWFSCSRLVGYVIVRRVPYMDPKRVRFNCENHITIILLMEKILHHSLKPCKWWDFSHINWLAGFLPSTVWIESFSCENLQQISEDRRRCQERGWIDEQTLSLQAKVHLISRWNLFVLYFGASTLQKTPIKTGVIWVPGR